MNMPKDRLSKLFALFIILFAIVSTFLGRSFTAFHPGDYDFRLFMYIGNQWLHGSIPYVDIWDNKPPGIFALIAIVFSQFPGSIISIAILEGIFVLGCITGGYYLIRQLGAPRNAAYLTTAASASACNLLFYNEQGGLTEIYQIFPEIFSMVFFVKAILSNRFRWMVLAGICSGLASLFKTPGLAPFLAQSLFLLLLLIARKYSVRSLLISVISICGGVLLAWLPFAIYFWWHGGLSGFVDASFLYNVSYGLSSQPRLLLIPFNIASSLLPLSSLVVCSVMVLVYSVFTAYRPPQNSIYTITPLPTSIFYGEILVILWVFFDLIGASAGGRNYHHYFLPLASSLSVCGGLAYWMFVRTNYGIKNNKKFLHAAIFALILYPPLSEQTLDFQKAVSTIRDPPKQSLKATTDYLNAIRNDDDTLFVWDYYPILYFATDMKSPTRFLDGHYYYANNDKTIVMEILNDLKSENPSFIVDRTKYPEDRARKDYYYREFLALLDRSYILINRVDDFRIYEIHSRIKTGLPYVAPFLAFKEVPPMPKQSSMPRIRANWASGRLCTQSNFSYTGNLRSSGVSLKASGTRCGTEDGSHFERRAR